MRFCHPAHPDSHPSLFNSVCHKSLFSPSKPKPAIIPPAVMPTPDDAAVLAAKKKKQAAAMQASGRAATILTEYGASDKLGG